MGEIMQDNHLKNFKQLGMNITYYRKKCGLSQAQLAEKLNISRTHMSRIETATCAASLDVLFSICDILNVSPQELFEL